MSIIEKAVNKLDKPDELSPARDNVGQSQDEIPLQGEGKTSLSEPQVPAPEKREVQTSKSLAPENKGSAPESDTTILELPLATLKKSGMVTPDDPRSRIAEENRVIKRPLLMNIDAQGKDAIQNANLIMVTSAQPGEGKTYTAINLALSIAMEQDKTVLLVDADVAKASACNLLGIADDSQGLIDLLHGSSVKVRDVLLRTSIPNLRVLPAGQAHERSTELLASQRMQEIMEELSARYRDRVIIFDSPPLLFTTEATVLANLMGQIVFVVAENQTPQHKVTEALATISEDKTVGLVMNKSKRASSGGKYGYGYGYGYGRERAGNA